MRFEEKLRKQMLFKGFNQQKLARASGVSDSEVSRILGGKSLPGLDNAMKLARALGVSLDYLADDSRDSDFSSEGAKDETDLLDPAESEIIEASRQLGTKPARRVLETVCELGYDVAIRRLLEIKHLHDAGDVAPSAVSLSSSAVGERRALVGVKID